MDYCSAEDVYKMVNLMLVGPNWNVADEDRLNTKIDARGLEITDLVKDLSDGVRVPSIILECRIADGDRSYSSTCSNVSQTNHLGVTQPNRNCEYSASRMQICLWTSSNPEGFR